MLLDLLNNLKKRVINSWVIFSLREAWQYLNLTAILITRMEHQRRPLSKENAIERKQIYALLILLPSKSLVSWIKPWMTNWNSRFMDIYTFVISYLNSYYSMSLFDGRVIFALKGNVCCFIPREALVHSMSQVSFATR